MAKAGALLLCLLVAPAFAEGKKGTADNDTVGLVEMFLKTPTAELNDQLGDKVGEVISVFMNVDPDTLPDKTVPFRLTPNEPAKKVSIRTGYIAKREELLALKKIADGKMKPPIRRLGLDDPKCGDAPEGSPTLLTAWKFAGFVEADEDDVREAEEESSCSECEMETEFTLKRMRWDETLKGKKTTRIRYFFMDNDPIWMFIWAKRHNTQLGTGTSFFGAGGSPRCH